MPFNPSRHACHPTKPFKYVNVCQTQSSASLCDLKVGKMRVDCCFLMSKMRWGELRGRDSGLMYLDLTFHQPADCKLAQATISMSFHDAGSDAGRHVRIGASELEVTEFFGPQTLSGEKRERQVSKTFEANPKVGAANASFEGIGLSRKSEVNYASRWKFTGSRFAADSSDEMCPRDSRYRQLVWHLEENELERQAVHHSIVHTALAFHHDSRPFYLDLQIEVKMQRWHHRFRQHLIYPPRHRRALTRAKIKPAGTGAADPLFPSLARNLNQALIEENMHPVVEVSDPKPAILSDEIQESDIEPESESQALLALARQLMGQEPTGELTVPRRSAVMSTETADSSSSNSSSSSSSTLVGSRSSNEPGDRTDTKTDVPEVGDHLSSDPSAEVTKVNTIQEHGHNVVLSLVRQTSRLLATLVASLILGLTGVQSALSRAGK